MTFRGRSHSLQDYVVAIEEAGLLVERLREPMPADPSPHYEPWRRVPMFLHLRAVAR